MTQQVNAALTYAHYLRLDQVLTAQRPRSDRHDEMLFIVMHQVYELWFKQILHELDRLQRLLASGDTARSGRALRRILALWRTSVAQFAVLETMTPPEFVGFRDWLEASSGFESAQFREIEAVLGRRDRRVVERYLPGTPERERIAAAMSRPALGDSFARYLVHQGYAVPAEVVGRDVREPAEPSPAMQDLLARVYSDDGPAVGVCEHLVDLDAVVQEWRHRHVKMVERVIGGKRGTAGSAGSAYLRTTVGKPVFPDLWAARDRL
ncbi:tryptophan 2,3-dioxygenase [Saccharothrix australiensis]|uniref:Tryptophan 2,3-dioxygenase n=1 Tax=Saccharothrix australiensis TaxID=2072 RepID=A0A495W0M2_9PSEU|nr:tryptophan 2,3-dioxygenase family protein [Saccharothrix australiensis]RKT54660.1 tryptophan 2,3-dioxygenase [Saccharothrix australiensis]